MSRGSSIRDRKQSLLPLVCLTLSQTANAACPCGPASFVTEFRTNAELKAIVRPETGLNFIQEARAAVARDRRSAEIEYGTVDSRWFGAEMAADWAPFVSTATDRMGQWARDATQERLKARAIELVSRELVIDPSIQKLSVDAKNRLIGQALKAAQTDPTFTVADAYQNTAIELLTSAVADLNTRMEFLQRRSPAAQGDASLGQVIQANQELQQISETLKSQAQSMAKQTAAQSGNPVSDLSTRLLEASSYAQAASQQLDAAAGIARRLGSEQAARTFSRGSQLAGTASLAVRALAGDPTSYLPAINAVMSFGGGGDDGTAAALAQLSRQISELSKKVEEQHKEVMSSLDYITYLDETSLAALQQLLADGLNSCRVLMPDSWKVADSDKLVHVAYDRPLIFASYAELTDVFRADSWGRCRQALARQLEDGAGIGPSFKASFSPAATNKRATQAQLAVYQAAKVVYPRDGTAQYLIAPPRWAEDLNVGKSFYRFVARAAELAGKGNSFEPLDASTDLLDPYITEQIGGYILALHSLYGVTNGADLLPFGQLSPEAQRGIFVGVEKMRSALGHVNLAIAQQQMLYGTLVKARDDVTRQEMSQYLTLAKFAPVQMGRIATGMIASEPLERRVYNMAVKEEISSIAWLQTAFAPAPSSTLGILKNIRFEARDGKKLPMADVSVGKDGASVSLILPSSGQIGDVAPLAHPDIVLRLHKLQVRLMAAIESYSNQTSANCSVQSDCALDSYYTGALLYSAAWLADRQEVMLP